MDKWCSSFCTFNMKTDNITLSHRAFSGNLGRTDPEVTAISRWLSGDTMMRKRIDGEVAVRPSGVRMAGEATASGIMRSTPGYGWHPSDTKTQANPRSR